MEGRGEERREERERERGGRKNGGREREGGGRLKQKKVEGMTVFKVCARGKRGIKSVRKRCEENRKCGTMCV